MATTDSTAVLTMIMPSISAMLVLVVFILLFKEILKVIKVE